MKKIGKIISLSVLSVLSIGLTIGDYFAKEYRPIISGFLGLNEQIEEGGEQIEDDVKTGDSIVRRIAEEGIVLLKNEKNADGKPTLPLSKDTSKLNVFGWGATDDGFLLAGNGSGKSVSHESLKVPLLKALEEGGYSYNKEIIEIYEKHCKDPKDRGETADWNNRYKTQLKEPETDKAFPSNVIENAKNFSDTALVVLSRYSGEYIGRIAEFQQKQGLPNDSERTFSMISKEEETLLKMCTSNFKNVVVIFNSGSIMDMSFLDDEANIGKIGAALNIGYVGQSGATAIPKILKGEISPSGKLADTVLFDPKRDEITKVNHKDGKNDITYAEDIYLGYKFYETANVEGLYKNRTRGSKKGYDAVVQYPFGHGLSYTNFDWEVENISLPEDSFLTKKSEIEISIKVTNTGEVSGQDVVGLYFTAPYYKGGIEKASINLLNFAKTDVIKPNEYQVVKFKVTPYEMASYDAYSKNENSLTGWELDPGTYELKLMTDSHNLKDMENNILTYKVQEGMILRYQKDPKTNKRIKNRFTGQTAYGETPLDGSSLTDDWKYLSRSDFDKTLPKTRCRALNGGEISGPEKFINNSFDAIYTSMPNLDIENNLRLVTKEDGSFVKKEEFEGTGSGVKLKYNDELMFELGKDFNNPKWEKLLDQLSIDELRDLVEGSGYKTQAIESIGKPALLEFDGPSGFNRTNMAPNVKGSKMTAFPAQNLMAQTWNKELIMNAGQIVGIDGQNFGINGIYAPVVNLHRETLNERNYECYSEDPVLSGFLAASFIKGAKSNGVHCYLKHLALYDASPYTNVRVWLTEQNFRETYLRPFEIAIKEGGANGLMASFNKIGATWAGSNDALINGIVRTEWGFNGTVITDYSDGSDANMNIKAGLRGGLNTELNPKYPATNSHGVLDVSNPVDVNLARQSAKSIIYTGCNTYYFAKNNDVENEFSSEVSGPKGVKTAFEWWIPLLVVINVVVYGALLVNIFFMFYKKKKE